MTERTDPGEMLRAANPVDSYSMNASDLDEMVRHITASPVALRHEGRVRRRHARTASIGAGFAVVVAGVTAALTLGGGQGLQVLSLRTVHLSSSGETASGVVHGFSGRGGTHDPVSPVPFVAGPELSNATSSAPVYSYSQPSDPTGELSLVASTLGVMSPVTQPDPDGCGIEVADDASMVFSNCSKPAQWTYNLRLPACHGLMKNTAGVLVPCPVAEGFTGSGATQEQLQAWSSSDASLLLPSGLTLGGASYGRNYVSYPCEFDGVLIIGCAENFQYTNAGDLLYASGPLDPESPIASIGAYPLISPVQGVAQINQSASTPVSHGPGPVTLATVTLTTSTVQYATATLTNGTTVLLPAFMYSGSDGGNYSTDAVAPSYLIGAASP